MAQLIIEIAGTAIMPPAVFNVGSPDPVASTSTEFDMLIAVVVALAAIVSCMLATTPAAIAFAFGPVSRQVSEPAAEVHKSVFPAAVAAEPAVAPMLEIWLAE
jgi:hypothetical protein